MGDKRGKVFVQQQDLGTLALKKRKKLRRKLEDGSKKQEPEGPGEQQKD